LNARLIGAASASKGRRRRGCRPSIGAAPARQKNLWSTGARLSTTASKAAAEAPEWEAEMEMGRAGKFQKVVGRARSLCLFTRAGARAPYLVREIVQNGACGILFAARAILARCWRGQNAPQHG
jgi:hypothetical protein